MYVNMEAQIRVFAKSCWQPSEVGERHETDFSLRPPIGIYPANLDFRLLVSSTMREQISIVLCHPVCGVRATLGN